MLSPPLSLAFLPFFPPFLSFKYCFQDYFGEGVTARKSKRKKTTLPACVRAQAASKGSTVVANRGGDSSGTSAVPRLGNRGRWHGAAGGREGGCGLQRQENLCAFSSLLAVSWEWDSHTPPMSLPHPTGVCPTSRSSCSISSNPAVTRSGDCAETSAGRGAQGESVWGCVWGCVSPTAPPALLGSPQPGPRWPCLSSSCQTHGLHRGHCRSRLWEAAAKAGQDQDLSIQPPLPGSTAGQRPQGQGRGAGRALAPRRRPHRPGGGQGWARGTGLPGRQVTPAWGCGVLPPLLPFTSPIFPQTNRAAAPASPCNDSAAAKFNIAWRTVRTRSPVWLTGHGRAE